MPRYYFDVEDEQGIDHDAEGLDYPNDAAAIDAAERTATGILASELGSHAGETRITLFLKADGPRPVATVKVTGSTVR